MKVRQSEATVLDHSGLPWLLSRKEEGVRGSPVSSVGKGQLIVVTSGITRGTAMTGDTGMSSQARDQVAVTLGPEQDHSTTGAKQDLARDVTETRGDQMDRSHHPGGRRCRRTPLRRKAPSCLGEQWGEE